MDVETSEFKRYVVNCMHVLLALEADVCFDVALDKLVDVYCADMGCDTKICLDSLLIKVLGLW